MPIQQKLTPPVLLFSDFAGWVKGRNYLRMNDTKMQYFAEFILGSDRYLVTSKFGIRHNLVPVYTQTLIRESNFLCVKTRFSFFHFHLYAKESKQIFIGEKVERFADGQ